MLDMLDPMRANVGFAAFPVLRTDISSIYSIYIDYNRHVLYTIFYIIPGYSYLLYIYISIYKYVYQYVIQIELCDSRQRLRRSGTAAVWSAGPIEVLARNVV